LAVEKSLMAAACARWPDATRFRDLESGQCHAFLPGQEGSSGWCCGRPVVGGDRLLAESYCAEHRALFIMWPMRSVARGRSARVTPLMARHVVSCTIWAASSGETSGSAESRPPQVPAKLMVWLRIGGHGPAIPTLMPTVLEHDLSDPSG
jgi:hypothetical protein